MTEPKAIMRSDYKPLSYKITHCDLQFFLDDEKTKVIAKNKVQVMNSAEKFLLNGENLVLNSVKINGETTEFEILENILEIKNPPKSDFLLEIKTEINPVANLTLDGLYKSGEVFCTQCEAEGFRKITYFLDRPDNLCIFSTEIIADKNIKYLLSNGNKISEEINGEKKIVKWSDPFAKPCYLFALVAGNFDVLEDEFTTKSKRNVKLQIFVDKGNRDKAKFAMSSLKKAMKWDEERFGFEYDLDIYMIVAVDFFNMGAMENKGLNVFNSKFVLVDEESATDDDFLNVESVIAHEYFHNWTGNRITCRDWFQLSLKEGLTVFRDQEFSMDMGSRVVERIKQVRTLRALQFAEDSGPMSHPIRPEKVIEQDNFYTVTIYEKGAEVIRMLHTILGEEKFMAGMRLYVERFDGKAATCDDFVDCMQDASKTDLSQFRLWYSQSGTPEVNISKKYDKKTKKFTLAFEQKTLPTADQKDKKPLVIPCDVAIFPKIGKIREEILLITEEKQKFVFENLSEKPQSYIFRNFSAPVKFIEKPAKKRLAKNIREENYFSIWDDFQQIVKEDIMDAINGSTDISLTLDFLQDLFAVKGLDNALLAEILTLPSEVEIAEWYEENIPVKKINSIRKEMHKAITLEFFEKMIAEMDKVLFQEYSFNKEAIGKRKLHGAYIYNLAHFNDCNDYVGMKYFTSGSMSETIAALKAAVHCGLDCKEDLLDDFERKWQDNPLVMDKWFAIQATAPNKNTLKEVKALMKHPKFDFSNPNRIRSLIASFASQNPIAFHQKKGYEFLREIVEKLDTQNPQIAARLVTSLTMWKKYEKTLQELMKAELEKLIKLPNLSRNLYEVVSKSLE